MNAHISILYNLKSTLFPFKCPYGQPLPYLHSNFSNLFLEAVVFFNKECHIKMKGIIYLKKKSTIHRSTSK